MRIRRIDETGDMLFGGAGQSDLYHDQPEAVALYVMYRLRLNYGEWFADMTLGTPWATEVLGERTQPTRDVVLQTQVGQTPGVADIVQYGSRFDPNTRTWNCQMTIDTIYGGAAQVTLTRLPVDAPPTLMASTLGVIGTPQTKISMTVADLTLPGRVDVTDFKITIMDAGRF